MTAVPENQSVDKPASQKISTKPTMKDLLNSNIINEAAPKWFDLGLILLDDDHSTKLQTIRADFNDSTTCCREMFIYWLQIKPYATWSQLIDTLKSPGVNLNSVATMAEKFLGITKQQHEVNKQIQGTYMDDTSLSTLTRHGHDHEGIEWNTSNSNLQQTSEADAANEIVMRLPGQSETQYIRSADATSDTASHYTGSATNYLQPNKEKKEDNENSRICEAVSQHYKGRFICQWISEKNINPISSLAALLIEREDGEMKVVVLTTGTIKKEKCSYSLSGDTPDECMWGYCDGHAVSVCYRFAVLYLITEMHRYGKNHDSILEMDRGGYTLKENIKLHFFSTKMPCGFMAEEDCPLLSWKIPFKGKPHCLKCSSIILIGAYLGIQGPLSHLFSNPVYISSITIPRYGDVTEIKDTEKIIKQFENLDEILKNTTDSNYKLIIPYMEIADVDSRELFSDRFVPCEDEFCLGIQIREKQAETEINKKTGVVINTDSNIGSQGIIFNEESKLGTGDFRKRMALHLKKATEKCISHHKVLHIQLDSLKKAQQTLSGALNVNKAIENLKISLNKEMQKKFPANYQSGSEMEQCRPIINQVTEHTNKWKIMLCDIIERFENDPNIQTVTKFLPLLKQRFKTNSSLLKESLDSLNKSMTEFENDTKSIVDVLAHHYDDYQETLDALNHLSENCNSSSSEPLDLMSCDWARYLRAMDNDIKIGNFGLFVETCSLPPAMANKNKQQELSNENESHAFDQEFQNPRKESEQGKERLEERELLRSKPSGDITGNCDSVTSLPSSASLPKKQQHNTDNDSSTETKPEVVSEANETTNNNVEVDRLSEPDDEVQELSQTVSSSSHFSSATAASKSESVIGNNTENGTKQETKNLTVDQVEELSIGAINLRDEKLPRSSPLGIVTVQIVVTPKAKAPHPQDHASKS